MGAPTSGPCRGRVAVAFLYALTSKHVIIAICAWPHHDRRGVMGSEEVGRVRREVLALIVLSVLAIGVFLGTRLIAKWEQQRSLADAAAWYARGMSSFESHQNEEAVTALRRAYATNRKSRQYAIALAHALSASGFPDDATRVLLTLREATPEDPEINL